MNYVYDEYINTDQPMTIYVMLKSTIPKKFYHISDFDTTVVIVIDT